MGAEVLREITVRRGINSLSDVYDVPDNYFDRLRASEKRASRYTWMLAIGMLFLIVSHIYQVVWVESREIARLHEEIENLSIALESSFEFIHLNQLAIKSVVDARTQRAPQRPVSFAHLFNDSGGSVLRVVSDRAQAFSQPQKNSKRLLQVKKGVRLFSEVARNGWHRVMLPTGERGWISYDHVEVDSAR